MTAKERYIEERVNELLNLRFTTFLEAYNNAKDEWDFYTTSAFRNTYTFAEDYSYHDEEN